MEARGRGGAFLPACVCHTQMYYNFGHTGGTFSNADWNVPADSGVTPAAAAARWWRGVRPLAQATLLARHDNGSSLAIMSAPNANVHLDNVSWPDNQPCAKFGVPKPL